MRSRPSFPIFLLPFIVLHFFAPTLAAPPLWSTYRPAALVSLRARVPHSPILGLLYYPAHTTSFRHLASSPDLTYTYTRHDGATFSDHQIHDTGHNLLITTTHLLSPSGAWTLRLAGQPLDPSRPAHPLSLVFYVLAAPDDLPPETVPTDVVAGPWGSVGPGPSSRTAAIVVGKADSIGGDFRFTFRHPSRGSLETAPGADVDNSAAQRARRTRAAGKGLGRFFVAAPDVGVRDAFNVEDAVRGVMGDEGEVKVIGEGDGVGEEGGGGGRLVLVQRVVSPQFEMEVCFGMGGAEGDVGDVFDRVVEEKRTVFDSRFEKVFGMKGYDLQDVVFARAALSNLLGGIGYFFGSTVVKDDKGGEKFLDPRGLLTASPSRAVFPRGFLWDEGFHHLVVQQWDAELSEACLSSWLDKVNGDGWIPREQVLGMEARHRFPAHVRQLMVQDPSVANPPTLLMPLRVFASAQGGNVSDDGEEGSCQEGGEGGVCKKEGIGGRGKRSSFIDGYIEQIVRNFNWLRETQAGEEEGTFRWRGRTSAMKAPEGYPLTLASGLDDYPRGERTSVKERHLDLHCWIAWAARALSKIHSASRQSSKAFDDVYSSLVAALGDAHRFRPRIDGRKAISGGSGVKDSDLLCDFDGQSSVCERGYVTILPLALGLLKSGDPLVGKLLDLIESEEELAGPAGVRSLSRQSSYYRKGNDYWTGSTWMTFNYLVLASLKTKYSVEAGPFQERAGEIYKELRSRILENTRSEFERTGNLWENYSPDDGRGKSGRQFTGWSALVVLIYGEAYDGVVT